MATPRAEAAYREVAARFPQVAPPQFQSCRKIAGSSRWSQHAWGNAVDIFGPLDVLDDAYRWLDSQRSRLGIVTMCWRAHGPCKAGTHDDHIHIDFTPTLTGTPPCAGGPAVTLRGDTGPTAPADGADEVVHLLDTVSTPAWWLRVLQGAAGIAAIAAGLLMLGLDLLGRGGRQ